MVAIKTGPQTLSVKIEKKGEGFFVLADLLDVREFNGGSVRLHQTAGERTPDAYTRMMAFFCEKTEDAVRIAGNLLDGEYPPEAEVKE